MVRLVSAVNADAVSATNGVPAILGAFGFVQITDGGAPLVEFVGGHVRRPPAVLVVLVVDGSPVDVITWPAITPHGRCDAGRAPSHARQGSSAGQPLLQSRSASLRAFSSSFLAGQPSTRSSQMVRS